MTQNSQKLKLLNIQQTQNHPFHVLTDSKLPIFMATFVGLLALSVIAKFHDIDYNNSHSFSFVTSQLLDPFFSANELNYLSINAVILTILIAILLTIGS
jgi:hypothetical protein